MKDIYIYGCGGVGSELAEMLICHPEHYNLIGFIDDNSSIHSNMGFDCVSFEQLILDGKNKEAGIVISVGEPFVREMLSKKIEEYGLNEVSIDLSAHFNPSFSKVKAGTIMHFNAYVSVNVIIGKCCLINKYALIGHDCRIGDYCVISPRVTIGGNVTIGNNTFIGTGASIRNGITIGKNAIIGMGAVVVKDVQDGDVVVGNPAKFIRKNESQIVFKKE